MGRVLSEGPIFEIREDGELAICELKSAHDVSREEGARCAELMRETITNRIAIPYSGFRGLLFDVRRGPPAFGPKTRAELERVFTHTGILKFKVGVLVSDSATQQMQFGNLTQQCSAESSLVSPEPAAVSKFLQS